MTRPTHSATDSAARRYTTKWISNAAEGELPLGRGEAARRCARPIHREHVVRPGAATLAGREHGARLDVRQRVRKQAHFAVRYAAHDVCGAELVRMHEPGRLRDLAQRIERVAVEPVHTLRLVGHHERLLTPRTLRGDARGASTGVTGLRLDAAEREHEAAGRGTPVGAERHRPRDVERADDLAAGADLDAVTQVQSHERVVHEQQPFLQRRAAMVDEFEWRSAGAALLAVDDDEVRQEAGFEHGLADREPLPRVAEAELETRRLAARGSPQALDELQQTGRRPELRVVRRAYAIDARRQPP